MKKIKTFIIVLIAVVLGGCGKDIIREGKGDLVIEYTISTAYGTVEEMENYHVIRVYDDKKIEYGSIKEELKKILLKINIKKLLIMLFLKHLLT